MKHFPQFAFGLTLMILSLVTNGQAVLDNTFGKGVRVVAADSSFSMTFNYRMQNLFVAEMSDDLVNADDINTNWLLRRSRLKFSGFAYSPKLKYKMELGLSNRDHGGESPQTGNTSNLVLDAFFKWNAFKNFEIWVGQTKLPGNRERVISSQKLQFVDRSLVNSRFNIDRDMGIQFHNKHRFGTVETRQAFAISQGEGRNRTAGNDGGFEYTTRLEILPLGEFTGKGDYYGSDLKRETTPKISFGLTYDWNTRAARERGNLGNYVPDTAYNNLNTFFADMMFKYKGLSLAAEYADKRVSDNDARLLDSEGSFVSNYYTGKGAVVQAGYLMDNNWELAVRYTNIQPELNSGRDIQNMYTLGCSRYIVGHSLKVQSDFSYLLETDPSEVQTGEFIYRFQVEVAF